MTNIGLKVAYVEVLQPLEMPGLSTSRGKLWWAATIPVFWAVGLVLAPAIPQLSAVVTFGGALFGISFNWIFPSVAALWYFIREDAVVSDAETFDETTRTYIYVDQRWKRLVRGMKKRPLFRAFHVILLICSLGTCVYGCVVSIEQVIGPFQSGAVTSFSCKSPV